MKFMTAAGNSIFQDEFGRCFQSLPRTKYTLWSPMWPLWIVSVFTRYCLLFPIRFVVFSLTTILMLVVLVPMAWLSPAKDRRMLDGCLHVCMALALFGLGMRVRYHGRKPTPREPHIFVSNHTSVTDLVVASGQGRVHAVVAQAHGGLFGWISKVILEPLTSSLLFDRNDIRDRSKMSAKMKSSCQNLHTNPLLIFPEGTCVNNEYTVLFHKGAFELNCLICPIAIKYDKAFGDPYFNTREQTFSHHLFYLMTRWLMPVDVYWIRPQRLGADESVLDFCNRVKSIISETADLKNLSWDGYLKNYRPNREKQAKMRFQNLEEYSRELKRKLDLCSSDNSTPHRDDPEDEGPLTPERDYFPQWLNEDSLTDLQNEMLLSGPSSNSAWSHLNTSSRPETPCFSTKKMQ